MQYVSKLNWGVKEMFFANKYEGMLKIKYKIVLLSVLVVLGLVIMPIASAKHTGSVDSSTFDPGVVKHVGYYYTVRNDGSSVDNVNKTVINKSRCIPVSAYVDDGISWIPTGWTLTDHETYFEFTTHTNPIAPGKSLDFKVKAPAISGPFNATTYDDKTGRYEHKNVTAPNKRTDSEPCPTANPIITASVLGIAGTAFLFMRREQK